MSYSILENVYDKLEAMTVTYTDKAGASNTPEVYSQETLLDSVTGQTPCRLILPASGSINIMAGGENLAAWKISDLFILEGTAQGDGIHDEVPSLTRYMLAYADAIAKLWQIAYQQTTETRTLAVSIVSGKFEYPSQSGVYFWGVRCDMTIEELF
jgi:hypothetical protein